MTLMSLLLLLFGKRGTDSEAFLSSLLFTLLPVPAFFFFVRSFGPRQISVCPSTQIGVWWISVYSRGRSTATRAVLCGLAIPVSGEGKDMLTFYAGALRHVCVGSRRIYGTIVVEETSERFCKYTHTRHAPSRLSVLPAQISRASCLTF
jgi:hypothetical protein